MAKQFTQQEIEILRANPNVKAVRVNRLTLTYEFRLMLWQQWQEGRPIESVFVQNGFDVRMVSTQYIQNRIKNFKTFGKPSRGKNKAFGVNENGHITTEAEIQSLLESGFFIKSRKGIAFHPDFMNELYHQYPEIRIEDALKRKGIDPDIVGYQRIYSLKKHFDGERHERVGVYDDTAIEKLRRHPYIKRITKKQIVFHERFYTEAAYFDAFHIERILDIFEIDSHLIPIQIRNRLKYQLNYKRKKPYVKIIHKDIDALCRIEHKKQQAMMELIDAAFERCRECVPHLSCQDRKALCNIIRKIPYDEEGIYTKRAVLEKVGISKTSYYAILQNEAYGQRKQRQEAQDQKDIDRIQQVIAYKGYPKGSRQIVMMMPALTGTKFSRGKVIRLMRKGGLTCTVRKASAQKRGSKEMMEQNTKPNRLKRRFRLDRPGKNILTDVSYLKYGMGMTAYLSCLKDASSGRIMGAVVSTRNDAKLAEDTLIELKKYTLESGAMIHSDQGVLYLSRQFQQHVETMGLRQSMSRRGNCWDNASQESFFGHFKDECDYCGCSSVKEVSDKVKDYIDYYNKERRQWTRSKMTPLEFEAYLSGMNDEEFNAYLHKEEQRYEAMMTEAASKAKKRAADMGIEA